MGFYPTSKVNANNWQPCKAIGNAGEAAVAALFRALGLAVEQHQGLHPFDLTIHGEIEVKRDQKAASTGNVFVETGYRGNPSGISISAASGWAFVTDHQIHLMPTRQLRAIIATGSYFKVPGGQGAEGVLIPVEDIRRIARSIRIDGGSR